MSKIPYLEGSANTAELFVDSEGGPVVGDVLTLGAFRRPGWETPLTPAQIVEAGVAAGVPRVYVYSFAFDTEGLAAGVEIYTPTASDVLLDAWFEVTTAFDGTTPLADIGSFSGTTGGLFNELGDAVPLGTADAADAGAGLLINSAAGLASLASQDATALKRVSHSRFSAATPIKLVVSQTGLAGGTAIGGAAGAGKVFLEVATPVAL